MQGQKVTKLSGAFLCRYTATRCVGNICRYGSIMASHGIKVDHTYLAYDAVELLTALTVCWGLWCMKLLMKA